MQAITHASPMSALYLLNINCLSEDSDAGHYHQQVAEIDPPKYVAFYFHDSIYFFYVKLSKKTLSNSPA
jgi:hypothetical protein